MARGDYLQQGCDTKRASGTPRMAHRSIPDCLAQRPGMTRDDVLAAHIAGKGNLNGRPCSWDRSGLDRQIHGPPQAITALQGRYLQWMPTRDDFALIDRAAVLEPAPPPVTHLGRPVVGPYTPLGPRISGWCDLLYENDDDDDDTEEKGEPRLESVRPGMKPGGESPLTALAIPIAQQILMAPDRPPNTHGYHADLARRVHQALEAKGFHYQLASVVRVLRDNRDVLIHPDPKEKPHRTRRH
jgi:hypothetical protein